MTPAGLIQAIQTAIENEEWEDALATSNGLYFAKLFPQQKRDVFSHLCKVIESAPESTRMSAIQKCRELLPSFSDHSAESWAESLLSNTIAKCPDETIAIEEPRSQEEPEPFTDQLGDAAESTEPISASDIQSIRQRIEVLQNLMATDTLKNYAIRFGVAEELIEHSDRVWFLSEAYDGVRLCIVAPESNFMAQVLRELPLGEAISLLRLEERWLLPVPADPEEQQEALQEVIATMTEFLDEIVRSGNPIRCGSCGGELPPISKFCLHCGVAV